MVEVPNDVGVVQDSRAGRAVLDPLEWDKAMVAGLAQDQGVCVRPLARRLVDRVSGEASTVVLPCGSTQESRCPTCAKRARILRMHQCAEGWHLVDELPDLEPAIDDDEDDAEPDVETGSRGVWCVRPGAGAMPLICRCGQWSLGRWAGASPSGTGRCTGLRCSSR